MANFCGRGSTLLEYGAGAGIKTEILLDALDTPRVYVPIDIAGDFLDLTVTRMRARFPELDVQPVVADFTTDFDLAGEIQRPRSVAFFPGSTIGNLDTDETTEFLPPLPPPDGAPGREIIRVDLRQDLPTQPARYTPRT